MYFQRILLTCSLLPSLAIAQTGETAPRGTPLQPGRPAFLRQMKIFEDSSAFHFALLTDPSEDTLIFLVKAAVHTRPEFWLLAVQAEKISGSTEVTFQERSPGVLAAYGILQREEGPLRYGLFYSPATRQVWWVEDSASGTVTLASFAAIGLRYEPSLLIGRSPSVAFHHEVFSITPMLRLLRWLVFMGQIGLDTGGDDGFFAGPVFGASLVCAPWDARWYLLVGVTDYSVGPFSTNSTDIAQREHPYFTFGGGYLLGSSAMLDLSVLFPATGGIYGYGNDFYSTATGFGINKIPKRVDTILKLGLCVHTAFAK